MGNSVSALHQASLNGDISAVRVYVQEHPQQINDPEPVVSIWQYTKRSGHRHAPYLAM